MKLSTRSKNLKITSFKNMSFTVGSNDEIYDSLQLDLKYSKLIGNKLYIVEKQLNDTTDILFYQLTFNEKCLPTFYNHDLLFKKSIDSNIENDEPIILSNSTIITNKSHRLLSYSLCYDNGVNGILIDPYKGNHDFTILHAVISRNNTIFIITDRKENNFFAYYPDGSIKFLQNFDYKSSTKIELFDHNNLIYLLNSNDYIIEINFYNKTSNEWNLHLNEPLSTRINTITKFRKNFIAQIDPVGRLFIVGGKNENNEDINTIERFDFKSSFVKLNNHIKNYTNCISMSFTDDNSSNVYLLYSNGLIQQFDESKLNKNIISFDEYLLNVLKNNGIQVDTNDKYYTISTINRVKHCNFPNNKYKDLETLISDIVDFKIMSNSYLEYDQNNEKYKLIDTRDPIRTLHNVYLNNS